MTTLLQRDIQTWRDIGGLHTAEEIAHQPAIWRALADILRKEQATLAAFLGDALSNPQQRVILTGAGSSAYVGEIVVDTLNAAWPAQIRAIATTTLLTHHELYLEADAPTLLVSFARSGDSPESLAAVELLRQVVPGARFLNITCNADGKLARQGANDSNTYNLLMPEGSCDRGFAMTSSFSSMLLAALSVLGKDTDLSRLDTLAQLGEQALRDWSAPVADLGSTPRAARRLPGQRPAGSAGQGSGIEDPGIDGRPRDGDGEYAAGFPPRPEIGRHHGVAGDPAAQQQAAGAPVRRRPIERTAARQRGAGAA